MQSLTLPYPPSVNTYWRSLVISGSVRVVISERGRLYRESIQRHITPDLKGWPTERLAVEVDVYPPNKRMFDLDNLMKSLLDSLTHAGLWTDDGQIDKLTVTRMPTIGGHVVMRVAEYVGLPFELTDEYLNHEAKVQAALEASRDAFERICCGHGAQVASECYSALELDL